MGVSSDKSVVHTSCMRDNGLQLHLAWNTFPMSEITNRLLSIVPVEVLQVVAL